MHGYDVIVIVRRVLLSFFLSCPILIIPRASVTMFEAISVTTFGTIPVYPYIPPPSRLFGRTTVLNLLSNRERVDSHVKSAEFEPRKISTPDERFKCALTIRVSTRGGNKLQTDLCMVGTLISTKTRAGPIRVHINNDELSFRSRFF